jgi:hypothetical protein
MLAVFAGAVMLVPSALAGARHAGVRADIDWSSTARDLRGRNGERFTFACPANGGAFTVWGTDVYTDDSSVCTAAVHAGVITFAGGGTVSIEIRAGQSAYSGTTRNGVSTKGYGSWGGSFVLAGGSAGAGGGAGLGGSTWNADAKSLRGNNGKRYTFTCPAGGAPLTVWGSDVYTDDSSVCTAGVHARVITAAGGGKVTIEIAAGRSSYTASTRNGITTRSYGTWGGSFVVVGATSSSGGTGSVLAGSGWTVDTRKLRTSVGSRFTFGCPAGGTAKVVWGTTVYTDDSSVCTAAVHAGRITFTRGGRVTIEVRPGQRSYTGSTHQGVTTRAYGAWPGSFVIVGAVRG